MLKEFPKPFYVIRAFLTFFIFRPANGEISLLVNLNVGDFDGGLIRVPS